MKVHGGMMGGDLNAKKERMGVPRLSGVMGALSEVFQKTGSWNRASGF
jgi:hypothetical protein